MMRGLELVQLIEQRCLGSGFGVRSSGLLVLVLVRVLVLVLVLARTRPRTRTRMRTPTPEPRTPNPDSDLFLDVLGFLIVPEAEIDGMAQLVVGGPFGEPHLRDQFRAYPMRALVCFRAVLEGA